MWFIGAGVALLLVGIVMFRFAKFKTAGKIMLHIGASLLSAAAALVLLIMLILQSGEGKLFTRPQLNILMISLPAAALVCCLHIKKARRKAVLIPLIAVLALGFALNAQTMYVDSIPVVSASEVLVYSPYNEKYKEYMPEEECSFRLTEDMPRLDGATALYPVYASFYRAVYPRDSEWTELIECSTTSGAYKSIIDGSADIIFVADASKAQTEAAREKGVKLEYTPLGYEAFVFIVNSRNALSDITPQQIRDIYSGKITQWSELGVKGLGEILPYQRSEGSGSQTAFERRIGLGEELLPAKTEMVAASMGGLYETVADYRNFKNAIGYSFRYYCTEMLSGNAIKLLSINGVSPTLENIENGLYPFTDRFYAVTRADADENVRAFVQWMTQPQGQTIIQKVGYTPLNGENNSGA